MSVQDVIRAWKDADYRESLSEAARALLPAHPAGLVELSDEALCDAAAGASAQCVSGLLCSFQCDTEVLCSGGGFCSIDCTYGWPPCY